mgnify:FL=1
MVKTLVICLIMLLAWSAISPADLLFGNVSDHEVDAIRFAVIGDFGSGNEDEQAVANLVDSWDVDFVITTGDNFYLSARRLTDNARNQYDNAVGRYYCPYLKDVGLPDRGQINCPPEKQSPTTNRFFPTIGNHDRRDTASPGVTDYLNYFTLPGTGFENSSANERYYDFVQGPAHFFALDSDTARRDKQDLAAQKSWLQAALQKSTARWKIVYFHHAAYSSSKHGPDQVMQWPFQEWGADVVFQGHDHVYERIMGDDLVYFVSGNGGRRLYEFESPVEGSVSRFDRGFGAVLVKADASTIAFEAWAVQAMQRRRADSRPILVDCYQLPAVQVHCDRAEEFSGAEIAPRLQELDNTLLLPVLLVVIAGLLVLFVGTNYLKKR